MHSSIHQRLFQDASQESTSRIVRACIDGDITWLRGSGQAALTEHGLGVNAVYSGLQKALLHLAVEWDHEDVAHWLLACGADPGVKTAVRSAFISSEYCALAVFF